MVMCRGERLMMNGELIQVERTKKKYRKIWNNICRSSENGIVNQQGNKEYDFG